jgi:hypothetical protein
LRDDDGKRIIENYLLEVSQYLPQRTAREVIPELRSHLIEEATEGGEVSAQGARRAVSRMGDPKSIAEEFLEQYRTEYENVSEEEKATYPRGKEVSSRREFADRWLRSRHYHHARFYISPSLLRWILLPAFLDIIGTVTGFITTSLWTGQIASPFILLGGVPGFIVLTAIYYFLKMYVLETLRVVEGILKTYEGQSVSIDELSEELGMRRRHVRAAITDLRADGKIKASYDHLTGELIVGVEAKQPTGRTSVTYCSYCGAGLPREAAFCPNCGASMEQGETVALQPAAPQDARMRMRYESRQRGSRANVAMALFLVAIIGIAGLMVAVAILVPAHPVNLSESHTVPQAAGIDTVDFNMSADVAAVNLNFTDLTSALVVLNTSVIGTLPLFDQRNPDNMSSFITWAFNYTAVGNTITVTSSLGEAQPLPSGLSVICNVLIDRSMNTSVYIRTVTGGIDVNTVSGVVLNGLDVAAVTGGADINLVEGVSLKGNATVAVTTGGIDFAWQSLHTSGNTGVTLTTVTGGISATVTQSIPLSGNVTMKATCITGGIDFSAIVQGNIGTIIKSAATTGGISIQGSTGFSGASSLLQSSNYPAISNFNIDLETTTGGININAASTP